jgi:uncharacterized membrane protein YukC
LQTKLSNNFCHRTGEEIIEKQKETSTATQLSHILTQKWNLWKIFSSFAVGLLVAIALVIGIQTNYSLTIPSNDAGNLYTE